MILHGERASILQDLGPLGGDGAGKGRVRNRRKQNAVELLNHASVGRVHSSFGVLRKNAERKQKACENKEGNVLHTYPQCVLNYSKTTTPKRRDRGERIRRLAEVTGNPRLSGPCWKCISASRDAAGNLFPHEKLRSPLRTRSPGFSHFPRGRRRTSVRRFCRRLA